MTSDVKLDSYSFHNIAPGSIHEKLLALPDFQSLLLYSGNPSVNAVAWVDLKRLGSRLSTLGDIRAPSAEEIERLVGKNPAVDGAQIRRLFSKCFAVNGNKPIVIYFQLQPHNKTLVWTPQVQFPLYPRQTKTDPS